MADHTHIEWTDATWNPITGCSVISPGCTNCYAMRLAGTRLKDHPSRRGLTQHTKAGPVWTGEVRFNEGWLDQPLRWKKPRRIFVCAHGDLFHEDVPDAWIDQVFARMALSRRHTYQVLTKRAARMRAYLTEAGPRVWAIATRNPVLSTPGMQWNGLEHWPLPNVWLGVSAEDQPRADERIPELLATPAAVRWVSIEPMVGPVDLRPWLSEDDGCESCDDGEGLGRNRCSYDNIPREEQCPRMRAVFTHPEGPPDADGIPAWIARQRVTLDWIVLGGESGPAARPIRAAWAREVRDACAAAGVPFFFKQWGAWLPFPIQSNCVHGDGAGGLAVRTDGKTYRGRQVQTWTDTGDHRVAEVAARLGGKASGRLLDGVLHDTMPEVRHA